MKTVTLTVAAHNHPEAVLITPNGLDDGYSKPMRLAWHNVAQAKTLTCQQGQQVFHQLVRQQPEQNITLSYQFQPSNTRLTSDFWQQQPCKYTHASEQLVADVLAHINTSASQREQINQLIVKAQAHFNYGHGQGRFYDNHPSIPTVCGTIQGSCVDINTYILAAANALGITVQYVAGFWFHPNKTSTTGFHCWLVFHDPDNDDILAWDLAHHMKYGVESLKSGLNPAGGRRVAMSFGRGIELATQYGPLSVSYLCEPLWLLPNGEYQASQLAIEISEATQ